MVKRRYLMNTEWRLDNIYTSYDSPEFLGDMEKVDVQLAELVSLVEKAETSLDEQTAATLLKGLENFSILTEKIGLYIELRYEADSESAENMNMLSLLMQKFSQIGPVHTRAMKALSAGDFYEDAAKKDNIFADYAFLLQRNCENAKRFLSNDAEEMLAMMNVSGGSAWGSMASSLCSSLAVDYDGTTVTLPEIRNLAYSDDASVRKNAYEAEIAAYKKIEQPMAFAINNIKKQASAVAKKRGYSSVLESTLDSQNMTKETLDAMFGEIKKYLPHFHRYLRAKAKLLGYEGGLPWYELFAPVGESSMKFTVEEAGETLVRVFSSFSDDMANLMKRAFEDRWIDFYPRKGKSGGAFCAGAYCLGESRILTNFDGTFSAVTTLAHELGHAFHNFALRNQAYLNLSSLPMPLAETASTFNEAYLLGDVMDKAPESERLYLLQNSLSETTQIICDIYSRFLFESRVVEQSEQGFLSAEALCGIMLDAQKEAYGDGLDENCLHPYMWVCKSHYYSAGLSFYNFPYAFGGLLSSGLYAECRKNPEGFDKRYSDFLYATTINTIEDAALKAGIDVTDSAFWQAGLEAYKEQIDEFCALVDAIKE